MSTFFLKMFWRRFRNGLNLLVPQVRHANPERHSYSLDTESSKGIANILINMKKGMCLDASHDTSITLSTR